MEVVSDELETHWITFSHLYALIYNCHRGKDAPALKPEQVYRPRKRKGSRKQKPDFITKDVSIFKTVFIDHKLPDAKHGRRGKPQRTQRAQR